MTNEQEPTDPEPLGPSTAGVAAAGVGSGSDAKPAATQAKGVRTARVVGAWVLVVLTCIVAGISTLTVWANEVLLDTDQFVSVIEPISLDPAVEEAIAARTSEELVRALRIQERAEEVLPQRAGFLAFTLQSAAQRFVDDQLVALLNREGIQDAWLAAVRLAHQQIVAILRDQAPSIVTQDGVVSINLFPLIQTVLERLNGTGLLPDRFALPTLSSTSPDEARQQLSSALGVQLSDSFGVVPVAEAPQLEEAQRYVSIFDDLVIVLPIIALLLAAGTIAVSINRRRAVVALGVGIGAMLILLGLIFELVGREAVRAVQDRPTGLPIVQASVDALTEDFWQFLRPEIVVWFLVALVAFLLGRRSWFVAAGAAAHPAGQRLAGSGRLVAENLDLLRVAGLVLALVALFLVDLTWGSLLLIVFLFLVYIAAVTALASRWRPAEQSAAAP
ncbi:MAG: hypothetical protein AB7R89_08485 [Dehalococcoidia bacterium]